MNKFLSVIKVLINALMALVIIVGIIFILLYIIGIEPFVIESGSMEPTIQTGSVSFINKHTKYSEIKENDVIAFNLNAGTKVTHRVIKITDEGFETKGDANDNSDGITTTKNNFIGKNIFSIPKLGYVIKLTQTLTGKIVLVTIIVVILVIAFFLGDSKKSKHMKTNENDKNKIENNKDNNKSA